MYDWNNVRCSNLYTYIYYIMKEEFYGKDIFRFLAETDETEFKIQEEEIEECGWFDFDDAMKTLNYENDKRILAEALEYLQREKR